LEKNELILDDKPQILILDDSEINAMLLRKIVEKIGYSAVCFSNGFDALEYLKTDKPDIIISDISMPEMDGYEFCAKVKETPWLKDIPLVFISALDARDEKIKGFEMGAADFIAKPFETWEVIHRIKVQMDNFTLRKKLEGYNKRMHSLVREQASRIEKEHRNVLTIFSDMMENREENAVNHNELVGYNSKLLAQALQFTPKFEKLISADFIADIEVASRTHDIGKLFVPDSILNKPTELTSEEKKVIEEHAVKGGELLEKLSSVVREDSVFKMATNIAKYHHENWNGEGYPFGLAGERIPLEARIVAITGNFDSKTSKRSYKDVMDAEQALETMRSMSGTRFDPDIFEVFVKIKKKLRYEQE